MSKSDLPTAKNEEAISFAVHEIFISRTDKKGIIKSGNDVFVRVSGFAAHELINQPHNIIRHPDMPRAVFRLLWDSLKKNQLVTAYVKNRSKSGKHYWVYACVLPTAEGYISIRIKPTSHILTKVKELYEEMVEVEKEQGMEGSSSLLNRALSEMNFKTYQEFMLHSFREEMRARDIAVGQLNKRFNINGQNRSQKVLVDIIHVCRHLINQLDLVLIETDRFEDIKHTFVEHTQAISKTCEKLEHTAMNMSIAAHKLGKDGATLGVVSGNFRDISQVILKIYETFSQLTDQFLDEIESIIMDLMCMKVQLEMLEQLAIEVHDKVSLKKSLIEMEELKTIHSVVTKIFDANSKKQRSFYRLTRDLLKESHLLNKSIVQLDLIVTGGKLEGSRNDKVNEIFKPFLLKIESQLRHIDEPTRKLLETLTDVDDVFCDVSSKILLTEHSLGEIGELLSNQTSDESELNYGT